MKIKGIDVSKHNGSIDWGKVKNDGVEFAIIRIGYGGSAPVKDERFEENYKNAKANGLKVGTYLYSYANSESDVEAEVNSILKWLDGKTFDLPFYLDVEDNKTQGKLSVNELTNYVYNICERIEKAGYFTGIYASKNWLETKLDMNKLNRFTVWLAQWSSNPTYQGTYGMWQYTSDGSINGISGRVDMNYQLKELGGSLNITSNNENSKKSNEEVANEVIKGIWGNGTDRKNRLTNDGYDYEVIQNIVNQKLGIKSNEEIANEVIKGKWGNQPDRQKRLEEAGYNYKEIQKIVNERLK